VLTILQLAGDQEHPIPGERIVLSGEVRNWIGERTKVYATYPKGYSSPSSPDAFTLSPKPFASPSIRFARNQVPRRSTRRIIVFQIC